jgi:hypothetical protein
MITDAQRAANQANAAFSTGPKTEGGKARSSRNALTFGLFTMNDFVRDGEAEDYTKIFASLWKELAPEGTLEQNFTTEIVSATWRLRRRRVADETLGLISIADPVWSDPMLSPATEKQQKSVDRARAQAHNALRRSLAELRKLQTERTIRIQLQTDEEDPGLTDLKQDADFPADSEDQRGAGHSACPGRAREAERSSPTPALTKESIARPDPNSDRSEDQEPLLGASFCKPAVSAKIPRNAPCPCGSSRKYKRCCGNPTLNSAPGKAA